MSWAAEQLGYRPSRTALALRTGKSALLGLVVPDIANSFCGEIAARLERHVRDAGYRLLVCNTEEDPDLQAAHSEELVGHGAEGLALAVSDDAGCVLAREAGLPLVRVERPIGRYATAQVGLENAGAWRMLRRVLRERGDARGAAISPAPPNAPTLHERLKGLREGLAGEVQCARITPTRTNPPPDPLSELAARVGSKVDGEAGVVEAMVGLNNEATLRGFEARRTAGFRVPEEPGVAGIDDCPQGGPAAAARNRGGAARAAHRRGRRIRVVGVDERGKKRMEAPMLGRQRVKSCSSRC